MLRLITFGGLSLMHGATVLRSHNPRQRLLPMLALLAAEDGAGMSRDRIAALLWPDSDAQRARHSLEEVISQARRLGRLAGHDDVFTGGATVLDRAAVSADVWEFAHAVRARDLERVATFGDGRRFAADVSVEGCNALEARFAALGERYAREQRDALTQLVRRATALGDGESVVRWTQRMVDTDPGDRGATLALVDALEAQFERARALAAAERYQRYLQSLDVEPDAEVTVRIRQLRTTSASHRAPHAAGDDPPPIAPATRDREDDLERAEQALVEQAVAPRWRVAGPGARGTVVVSYPAHATDAPRTRAEVHTIRSAIAHHADPDRFVRVLRRTVALQHRHFLPVVDCGASGRLLYFVTAPRPALSLKARLAEEHQLPIADAVAVARALAAALAHAHEQGVVHGDLRPKHVYLTDPGAPVVGFVGVIDALTSEPRPGDDRSYAVTFGEQAYQSPEQLRRAVATSQRSDVYAFGAIVYEMLVGERPFAPGGAGVDLARKLTESPADLRSRRESVPEALERVVLTCLARVPADRYASGVALAEALAAPDAQAPPLARVPLTA